MTEGLRTFIVKEIEAARRISTPLVAIQTPDVSEAKALLVETGSLRLPLASGEFDDAPILAWTFTKGIVPVNELGASAIDSAKASFGQDFDMVSTTNPVEALLFADKLPAASVLILEHFHLLLRDERGEAHPSITPALLALRDSNKVNGRMTIMAGFNFDLPNEIAGSTLLLDEPYPDAEQIRTLVAAQFTNAGLDAPDASDLERAVDALSGLPAAFTVEQATARTLSATGLDTDALWERKRALISSTKGLTVWNGGETFDMIEGYDNIKEKLRRINNGKRGVGGYVFIDEIEKAMASATGPVGDSSGTSQDQLGSLLEFMQDEDASGLLFVGHPGTAKSVIAKAAGTEAMVPVIKLDLGAMKGGIVGQSEAQIRAALKTVKAVTQGKAIFVATSNNISALPPELLRRFRKGIYFFDLPTKEEREKIWSLYLKKAEIDASTEKPTDVGWTGAEIEACVDTAWDEGIPLTEAAKSIVPVAVSNPEKIERLRKLASGSFISASHPGVYRHESSKPTTAKRGARRTVVPGGGNMN